MKREQHPLPGGNLYAVGKLVGCFGIKGFIKVRPFTRSPERFETLRTVQVGPSAEKTRTYNVESIEAKHKGMIMKFETVDDRTAAEQLVGTFVFVDEEHLERPENGSYFIDELLGCEVVSTDGRSVGSVSEVYRLSGHDLWEVKRGSTTTMLPAVKEFIKDVDLAKRKITIQLIEGLFAPGDNEG